MFFIVDKTLQYCNLNVLVALSCFKTWTNI